mmetsp:Transcript_78174/g.221088  ORF Transcript_78174/g.221088 Transcript_78174/m.221088 type:complete len:370 (-) Transcript_78174:55-1164(-)
MAVQDLERQPLAAGKGALARAWPSWRALQDLGSVALFVLLGAGQALATRVSMQADGVIHYDSSAAVAVAEGAKLLVALLWTAVFDWHAIPISGIPKTWATDSLDLLWIAMLFALQNELNYSIIGLMGAALFMTLGNLKIVFTSVFMRTMLNKRFSWGQWCAVGLLTLCAMVVKMPLDGFGGKGVSEGFKGGFLLLLVSCTSSGLASVKNESILKKQTESAPMPFMMKNAILYVWGLLLNLGVWMACGKYSLFMDFDTAALVSIACLVGMGLAVAHILRSLDNVVRCFASVLQVLVTVGMSRMLPTTAHEDAFDPRHAAGLVILAAALVLYQAHDSPLLFRYLGVGCTATAGLAYMIYTLDHRSSGPGLA